MWSITLFKAMDEFEIIQKRENFHKDIKKVMGKQLLMMLILVVELQGYNGCLEKERAGLLDLKAFFTAQKFSMDSLTSWSGKNCCEWSGVQCNSLSLHVLHLSLNTLLDNEDSTNNAPYFFDASLIKPFTQLESLDLSSNGFSAFIHHPCNTSNFPIHLFLF